MLDAGVPCTAELSRKDGRVFARALVEVGLMKPAHWTGNVSDSIRNCLQALGEFRDVSVNLHYTDDFERANEHGGQLDASQWKHQRKLDRAAQVGAIWFTHGNPAWHVVGRTLDGLEAAMPGLGQTILCVLQEAGSATLGLISPADTFAWASHLYWQGEEDERVTLEEVDDPNCVFRRCHLEADIPAWSFHPKRLENFEDLEAVPLKSEQDRWLAAKILAAAKDLRTCAQGVKLTNDVGWLEYPSNLASAVILRWTEDATNRVLDDAYEYECQSGETIMDLPFLALFPWGDEGALRRILGALPEFLRTFRLLEDFINLIAQPA